MSVFHDIWREIQPTSRCLEIARDTLAQGGRIAVYGTGTAASDVIRLLRKKDLSPSLVLDAKSNKSSLEGLEVSDPGSPSFSQPDKQRTVVFMGIFNPAVDLTGLRQHLISLGWTNSIDFVELHAAAPEELGDRYWLTDRSFYQRHQAEITAAAKLWADDHSRKLYEDTLRFRLLGDDSGLRAPDLHHQYFPLDLAPLQTRLKRSPLRLIDCGACVGDVLKHIRKQGYPIESVACFEPDPRNYQGLIETVNSGAQIPEGAFLFPCGVSSRFEVLRFSSSQGAASAVSADGDLAINCLSIDESLPGYAPNFIKMDVEGAESAALDGARRTISSSRPALAISAYHRPADLWELPHLIEAWQLDYEFHLRQHMFRGFDLVLYAIPRMN